MSNYQVLARKYRPQSFLEVLGQDAIVTTLKNAIKYNRLAHAYLFCGSRGTGKTTLARVFAKALNCQAPTKDGEPCNLCSSCREITSGNSLDVLEIDGASHRGIDDIRQINETVGYAAASGKYKIYIIDEVHMLTKEAFNALLKTLEEPPPKVLFIFATTEPHKVLPTILSRCQRFNLNRISLEKIIAKLQRITNELQIDVDDEALHLLAQKAEGGLRDAESLFDQIIAFHGGKITVEIVADVLGVMTNDTLFALDQAGKEGRLSMAFEITHQLFSQGKDLAHFMESLTDHFRTILLIKLAGTNAPFLSLTSMDKVRYEASAKLYTQEQCQHILDLLIESQNQMRFQSSARIALEAVLLRIMRSHHRLSIEFLVRRLAELEQKISEIPAEKPPALDPPALNPSVLPSEIAPSFPMEKETIPSLGSTNEDPTPTPQDIASEIRSTEKIIPAEAPSLPPQAIAASQETSVPQATVAPTKTAATMHKQHRYDTLLQFAAIELEGKIQKK